MPRVCSICAHKDRRRIDAQLLEGVPNTTIAANTGVSEQAVRRHAKSHLPKFEVQAATEEREFDHFRKLRILEKSLYLILKRSLTDGDDATAIKVHASILRNMEFELRLTDVEDVKRNLEDLREEIERREIDR